MTRLLWFVLMTALLSSAGCFPGSRDLAKPTPTATVAPQPPPPVKVDQITDSNGHQIADALSAEIDWEMQQSLLKTPR